MAAAGFAIVRDGSGTVYREAGFAIARDGSRPVYCEADDAARGRLGWLLPGWVEQAIAGGRWRDGGGSVYCEADGSRTAQCEADAAGDRLR